MIYFMKYWDVVIVTSWFYEWCVWEIVDKKSFKVPISCGWRSISWNWEYEYVIKNRNDWREIQVDEDLLRPYKIPKIKNPKTPR